MKIHPSLIVCEQCDSVYRRRTLQRGELALCQRCNAPLLRHANLGVDRWLALSIATLVSFTAAIICPSLKIGFQGLYNEATLWQAVWALASGASAAIAIPATFVAIIAPFVQLTLLIWVLGFARFGQRAPGFVTAGRTLFLLRHWSMIEVALVGVLITMVKLSASAQVQPLAGLWATGLSMIGLTLVTSRDMRALWDIVDSPAPLHIREAA